MTKVSTFEEEDEVYEDDVAYPSVLSDHPPPSTKQPLPPIRVPQIMSVDKVNVVQPLKDKGSSDSDLSKSRVVLDEAKRTLPSTSNLDGSVVNVSGDKRLAADIEEFVTESIKQSTGTDNEISTYTAEPKSKLDANVIIRNETNKVTKRKAPLTIAKNSKKTVSVSSPKTSKNSHAKSRSPITQTSNKQKTDGPHPEYQLGRNGEPVSNLHTVHNRVVPIIDISQRDDAAGGNDVDNPPEITSDLKINSPIHESGPWFDDNLLHPPITVVNTKFEKPLNGDNKGNDLAEADHLNLDSVSNTDTDTSVKQSKYTENSEYQSDPHLSATESILTTQQQVSSVANINSQAPDTVPSVEDVTKAESSPVHSSKSGTEPETDNTVGGTYETDPLTSSDSEIDIQVPKHKPSKPFLHETEESNIRMPIKRDSLFFSDESTAESKGPPRPEFQKGRSAMTLRSAASTRLLTSSYGPRPNESVKVYNPAIQMDPKVKEQKQRDVEKERENNEKSRKRRFTAMKGIYKSKQPKGVNSRRQEYK